MSDAPAAPGLAGLLDELVAVEQATARLAAQRIRVLAAIHAAEQAARNADAIAGGYPAWESAADRDRHWVSEEVGLILKVGGNTAQTELLHAHQLVTRLGDTVAMLETGELHPAHALRLSDAITTLTDQECADVQARVLPRAAGQSKAAFARSLHRAVMSCAPKTAEQAHTEALSEQRVEVRPLEHGMALLLAWLPAPDALRIKAAITTRAKTTGLNNPDGPDACHAIDHRRATALIELIDLGTAADPNLTASAPGVAVQVTISLATLLGLSSQPAELAGYGPIPPAMARTLATDPNATWRRMITDPTGRLTDYGRQVYKPPIGLDRFVRARDQVCTFPNCHRQAVICDVDHVIPRNDGGETNQRNLVAVCARHHHLKHDAGWTNHYNPTTSVVTWTSPTGHTYTNPPALYPHETGEPEEGDPPKFRRAS